MNKRLRKKKHVGEFNFFGFRVEVKFEIKKLFYEQVELVDQFVDKFIEIIEAAHLEMGGGINNSSFSMFITKYKQGKRNSYGGFKNSCVSCTDEDRQLVENWLKTQTIFPLTECQIGPLKRAWDIEST